MYIRVPRDRKVRFKDDGKEENDFNTGLVNEFVPLPDMLPEMLQGRLSSDSIPDEAFEEVGKIAYELGIDDLHPGNMKFDPSSKEIWLHDIENLSFRSEEIVENSWLLRPLRPYFRWQLAQNRKYDGGSKFSVGLFFMSPSKQAINQRISNEVSWIKYKTEPIKIVTAFVLYQVGKYLIESFDRTTAKFVFASNQIDQVRMAVDYVFPSLKVAADLSLPMWAFNFSPGTVSSPSGQITFLTASAGLRFSPLTFPKLKFKINSEFLAD